MSDERIAELRPPKALRKYAAGGALYLWHYPNGSRLWRLRYRLDGKQREYAIGAFGTDPGEFDLEGARAEAQRARDLLANGRDPVRERQVQRVNEAAEQAQRRAEQAARLVTLETLAEDWFIAKGRKWSAAHRSAQRARLDREILPVLGSKPLGLIDAPLVLAFLQGIERSGRHEVLAKCRILLSQVFRYGIATSRASSDPTAALRGAFEKPEVRHRATIPLKEFPKLFEALTKVPAEAVTKLALYWCFATVCRTHEMRGATWAELDTIEADGVDVALWRIEASRMKMRHRWLQPLSPLAQAIVERAKALRTSDDPGALIFPGFSRSGALSENALLSMLARAGYFGRQTTHGVRAAFAEWAHPRGFDPIAVELCMAHRPGGVLGTYNRGEYVRQRLDILTAWAEQLQKLGLVLA